MTQPLLVEPVTLPLLPLRDVVVFPHMVIPLFVGRPKSIKALEAAMEEGKSIVLVAQKNAAKDDPGVEDLYLTAWKAGLKGLATYRPNKVLGSVLSVATEKPKEAPQDFRQDDRNFANQLYFSLRNGIASFPGSQQFVGVSIAKDRLDSLRLPAEIFKPRRERDLFEAIRKHRAAYLRGQARIFDHWAQKG